MTMEDIRVAIKVAISKGMTKAAIAVTVTRGARQTSHRTGEIGQTNHRIGATSLVKRVDFVVEETTNRVEATTTTEQCAKLHWTCTQVLSAQCCHQ